MQAIATIEMPMKSNYKYEVDKKTGKLVLDRVLSVKVPYNYGYINNTYFDDGDPIDVFVISENPIPPLCEVKVEILGILRCRDNGVVDDKLLAVIVDDDIHVDDSDVDFITEYLTTYKTGFEVLDLGDKSVASKILKKSMDDYEHDT